MTRPLKSKLRAFAHRCTGQIFASWGAWLPTLLLSSTAGCTLLYGDTIDQRQCQSQADCESTAQTSGTPLECREHVCQARICSETDDCPADFICVENACVADITDAGTDAGGRACEMDSDCESAEQRCGFDGLCYQKWGCLAEDPAWPNAVPDFSYVATVRRGEALSDPAAVGVLSARACSSSDPNCMRPTVLPDQVTVSEDIVASVPFMNTHSTGFTGFVRFEATASDEQEQMLPTYRVFTSETPLVDELVDRAPVIVVSQQTISLFTLLGGVAAEPGAAFVIATIHDCGGRPAPDMSLAARSAPGSFFLVLAPSGPVVGATATGADGIGTLGNLPPDKIQTLSLRDEVEQRTITSTLTFLVHGESINAVVYYPRYSAVRKWMEEAAREGSIPE
jgi:hypothetical protein